MTTRLSRILAVLAVVALIVTACGATPTATPLPVTPAAAAVTATGYPLTVTDASGRTVTLKAAPSRIVSLSPSLTEMLFAIGAGDQIVGVTTYCNYPPEALAKEKIGGYSAKTVNMEKILALQPDLVVAESSMHKDIISSLEQLGITAYAVKPNNFDDIYTSLGQLGRIAGHPDQAAAAVAAMKSRIKAVTDKVAAIPQDKRVSVFWEVWDQPLMTAGPATFTGQIIEMAGGKNVFADVTKDYPEISAEEIIKRNPAVIMGPDTHGDKLTTEQIGKRPGWESLAAVKSGRIYLINGDTSSRPGPRLALALEDIARQLYPDTFKQ
jgi:iron complex transport system substrate-binding protein